MTKNELLQQINDAASNIGGTNDFNTVDNHKKARMKQNKVQEKNLSFNKRLTSSTLNELPGGN